MEKLGINKDRLRLAWVSAAEGAQFAAVIRDMERDLHDLTPKQIHREAEQLKKALQKKSEAS
jgi:coenzyme F420-reducing hydrogenase delta subunit